MTTERSNIAAKLMDLDTHDLPGRDEYERALAGLFERRLSAGDWVRLALMGAGGLAGATVCGMLALTEPAGVPGRTRAALGVLAVIGMSWAVLAGVIVRRGSINSTVHATAAATMGFAFALLTAAATGVFSVARAGQVGGAGLVLLPVVPLALATVVLVVHHVRQAELRLRRDLLEMEHRLARRAGAGGATSADGR